MARQSPPPKSPIADPRTGIVTPEWLDWLSSLSVEAAPPAASTPPAEPVTPPPSIVVDAVLGVDGSGTVGRLAKWTAARELGDSLISEVGTTVYVSGTLVASNIPASGPSSSGGGGAMFLGATASEWVQTNPLAWVPASGVQIVNRGRTTGQVTVRLRARAGGVSARLYNVSTNVTAGGTAGPIASSAFVLTSFPVALAEGQIYELQLRPTLVDTDVQGIGYLE